MMHTERQRRLERLLHRWRFEPEPDAAGSAEGIPLRRRLYDKWIAFARVLGRINTVVLLTLVYLVVLGPVALVSRILRKDFLDRGLDARPSYWEDREEEEHTLERRSRQF
jgi:hypothetical protein